MNENTAQQEVQQKYMEFRTIQQQIEQISQHLELLQQQSLELDISKNALEELSKTAVHTEVLAPIAEGIFFKVKLQDNQKLVVNVGSNVTVERTIPETAALLETQKQEITARIMEAESILQELHTQAMKLYEEVEKYTQE